MKKVFDFLFGNENEHKGDSEKQSHTKQSTEGQIPEKLIPEEAIPEKLINKIQIPERELPEGKNDFDYSGGYVHRDFNFGIRRTPKDTFQRNIDSNSDSSKSNTGGNLETLRANAANSVNSETYRTNSGNLESLRGTVSDPKAKEIYARPVYEEKKLTIVFVENTKQVASEVKKLEQIVKSLITTGFICVVNYGSTVRKSEIMDIANFDYSKLFFLDDLGENASMYDALVDVEDVVKDNYNKHIWSQCKRARISSIDIIGFGRCVDNYSRLSREVGIKCFERTTYHADFVTKYFCLSDKFFVDASSLGFRSIGSINSNS